MSEIKIAVNSMYVTYQGEVNYKGIGHPVIFLRLQGCHIRCYQDTLGTLCDTPEALERDDSKGMTISEICEQLNILRKETGISYICLSGGDPLWRSRKVLKDLLDVLVYQELFNVSVETSGTIPMAPYSAIANVTWVLDYKLKSAGIKQDFCYTDLPLLSSNDFIKFVVYDEADYKELVHVVREIHNSTEATLAVGTYWGGKIGNAELFERLRQDNLLRHVVFNAQLHKMATFVDFNKNLISNLEIPKLI